MFICSKPKIGCSSSIINKWTCSSSFDVQKMMFEFVLCSVKWCLTHHNCHLYKHNWLLFNIVQENQGANLFTNKTQILNNDEHLAPTKKKHDNNQDMSSSILKWFLKLDDTVTLEISQMQIAVLLKLYISDMIKPNCNWFTVNNVELQV